MGADWSRLAVVDCGTNTFTLHIADCGDGRWKSVFRQKRFIRLGRDSFRSGRLSPQRMRRGLDVLASFLDTARNYGVHHVRAFGCSALRDASNGREFVQAAQTMGWHIEVIDGAAEAEWIHLGVADTMRHVDTLPDSLLTVDIGGGSVELVHWTEDGILGRWSLELGVARLTDWIKPSDPLNRQDLESVHRIVDGALAPVLDAFGDRGPHWMVGTSGAFNTLRTLENAASQWNDPRAADEFSKAELLARCRALSMTSKHGLHEIPGMHPDRVPYMAMACAMIEHLLLRFGTVERVFRSRHTLAEGVLAQAAAMGNVVGEHPDAWHRPGQVVAR